MENEQTIPVKKRYHAVRRIAQEDAVAFKPKTAPVPANLLVER